MHRINYAGGTVLTGSEIARGLLAYAEALAKSEDSATVEIPIRHADGSLGAAELLIGPASQLIAETESSDFEEIEDPRLVARFSQLIRELTHLAVVESRSADVEHTPDGSTDVDFDDFTNGDPDDRPGS